MDLNKLLSSFDPTTLAALAAGVGLVASWISGKIDLKALLAALAAKFPQPVTPTVVKPALTPATTNDVKLAHDRLAVVAAKVDELATTRIWLQQTEAAIRDEIASVRACADAMEARLKASPPAPETRS